MNRRSFLIGLATLFGVSGAAVTTYTFTSQSIGDQSKQRCVVFFSDRLEDGICLQPGDRVYIPVVHPQAYFVERSL